jgi:hypothetical protein
MGVTPKIHSLRKVSRTIYLNGAVANYFEGQCTTGTNRRRGVGDRIEVLEGRGSLAKKGIKVIWLYFVRVGWIRRGDRLGAFREAGWRSVQSFCL